MKNKSAYGTNSGVHAGVNSSPPLTPASLAIGPDARKSSATAATPRRNSATSSKPSAKAASSGRRTGLRSQRAGVPTEHASQAAVIQWANLACRQWPELRWLHAIPNGAFLGRDRKAAAIHASRLKDAGMRPGVCDLFLPAPRAHWHGLYIEMKRSGQRTTPEQDEFIAFAIEQGYAAVVCFDAEQAIATLREYLSGGFA